MGCKWKHSDGSYCDRNSCGKRYCYYHKKIKDGLIDEPTDDPITTEPGLANQLAQEFSYLPQLVASRFNYHDRSELESEGYVALLEAITTYDPATDKLFRTWAWYKLYSRMIDFIRKREKFNRESYDFIVEAFHDPIDTEQIVMQQSILGSDTFKEFLLSLNIRERAVFEYTIYKKVERKTYMQLGSQFNCGHQSIIRDRKRILKRMEALYEI